MSERREENRKWHLDKRVPIAMIFAIFMQTAGAFWWAGTVDARLANMETDQRDSSDFSNRLTRLEVLFIRFDKLINKLERRVDDSQ